MTTEEQKQRDYCIHQRIQRGVEINSIGDFGRPTSQQDIPLCRLKQPDNGIRVLSDGCDFPGEERMCPDFHNRFPAMKKEENDHDR